MQQTELLLMNRNMFKLSDPYDNDEIWFDDSFGEKYIEKFIMHRIESIVYAKLKKCNVNMGSYQKQFDILHRHNIDVVDLYLKDLAYVCNILKEADFEYAFLKGAYLIPFVYEKGMRRSNDIDILVKESDLDKCQKILLDNGFKQGRIINDEFREATRKEVIISRMNYGEIFPFCKVVDNRKIYIDVNFSLDYKPSTDVQIIDCMLDKTINAIWDNNILKTLDTPHFIIHLCVHLFKEATTLNWVRRKTDLGLYKFVDLNVMFHECCVKEEMFNELAQLINKYKLNDECYYALINTSYLFADLKNNKMYLELLRRIKPENVQYLKNIVDAENHKVFRYNMSFEEWFACEDRIGQLEIWDN